MKNSFIITLLCLCWANAFLFNACSRPDPDEPQTAEDQLPDITTSGKNTFGCLVNGKPYVMCAKWPDNDPIFGGSNPLHIGTGLPEYNSFGIETVDRCSENSSYQFESLDLTIWLKSDNSLFVKRLSYANYGDSNDQNAPCGNHQDFRYHDSTSVANFVKINKIDYTSRILAGEFEFDLYTPGCTDTVKIRKGRFDVKF